MSRPYLTQVEALTEALGPLTGLKIADIGCGSGGPTRAMVAAGADATGVEPNDTARAAAVAEGGTYVKGTAEATGLPGGAFDLAVFTMSLHHAADPAAALSEARRLLKPGGRIAAIEPDGDDPLHPLFAYIDDERPVLAAAQTAIDASGLTRMKSLPFAEKYRVASPAEMLDHMIGVNSERSFDEADRPAFESAFAAALLSDAEGPYLSCQIRLDLLTP